MRHRLRRMRRSRRQAAAKALREAQCPPCRSRWYPFASATRHGKCMYTNGFGNRTPGVKPDADGVWHCMSSVMHPARSASRTGCLHRNDLYPARSHAASGPAQRRQCAWLRRAYALPAFLCPVTVTLLTQPWPCMSPAIGGRFRGRPVAHRTGGEASFS